MPATEYTLTGFDDFLERHRVTFVDQVPRTRVCSMCGVVPSSTVLLPCGHVLCSLCESQVAKGQKCALDGAKFEHADVVPLTFKQCDLEQLRVQCFAGGEKCIFSGKLSELKKHLTRCTAEEVSCTNCGQTLLRSATADHYRRCSAENGASRHAVLTAPDVAGVAEGLGDIKTGLERLRQRGSREAFDRDSVVNDANALLEHVANLEHEFDLAKKASCVKTELQRRAHQKATGTYGPFRGACKPNAFITMCKFPDVYAKRNALVGDKKELITLGEVCTLAGYTFRLDFKLVKGEDGEVFARFIMNLRDGAWDSRLEWPFAMNVTVIVTHPRDKEKDARLSIRMTEYTVVKKPIPEVWNSGSCSESIAWQELDLNGFIDNKIIYTNVEFVGVKKDARLSIRMTEYTVVKKPTPEVWNSGSCSESIAGQEVDLNGFIGNKIIYTNVEFVDKQKDARLAIATEEYAVVKKPVPEVWNAGSCSESIAWKELDLNGFIDNKIIYTNVEFV
ncbi:hypothetical protein V5799_007267 [Amblyomma americanum]|uniref:RING-type domain-containing protein n=1 Tax=Amblyomma americanum TaxID=6943 RepID=A0AAQ4DU12_AMBAM